jgi:NADH:ubiquinone reductase (H+-translocating)
LSIANSKPARIVILGGGFGGVYTALQLEKTLARRGEAEVTLVNRDNFFLFTPLLHEVAASDLDITNIVNPIRKMLRHVRFVAAEVESIDLENRRLKIAHGLENHHHTLGYDQLVISLGATTNFFNVPGLQGRALTMKSLGDAINLRNRLIANLEEANFECSAAARRRLLTFLVAGAGFAGVETIAALNDFVRDSLRFYPCLSNDIVRMVLVHAGEVILPECGNPLGRYAERKLRERQVEIKLNCRLIGLSEHLAELSDGTSLETDTLIWTAGTSPNPLLATLPCKSERGRIVVDEFLEVPGFPGVWALGDCAMVPDPKTGKPQPPTAQHALREGKVVAQNIAAAIRGAPKKAFSFATLGQLAAIGKRTGVANILGINFSGFIAWWLWRTIYLTKLPRLDKKIRVMLDWTLDLLFSKDLVQLQTFKPESVSAHEAAEKQREA